MRPKVSKYQGEQFPAVLRIAGGWGTSTFLLDAKQVREAAERGLIVVAFDSFPKKEYEVGSELRDYNGFKDQDDVALVLSKLFEDPQVNASLVSVWSHSNGITLAAGALGRHTYENISRQIIFLLDDEGPHSPRELLENPEISFHTADIKDTWGEVIDAKVGDGKQYATVDEFWAERCAINFIGNYSGVYQRVQAIDDHETGTYHGHAVAMINAATPPNGGAAWTRLNFQEKNQLYQSQAYPDSVDVDEVLDLQKFSGPNDPHIWEVFFSLLGSFQ
ncbi:MAG: alpha/beta hydrolase family protein [Promethearchaeota archaeon]